MIYKETFFEEYYIGVYKRLENGLEDYIRGLWVPGPKALWIPFRLIEIKTLRYKQMCLKVTKYKSELYDYYSLDIVSNNELFGIKVVEEPKEYRREITKNIKKFEEDKRIKFLGSLAGMMCIREDIVDLSKAYGSL